LQPLDIIDELRLNEELFDGVSKSGEPVSGILLPNKRELKRLHDKGLGSARRYR